MVLKYRGTVMKENMKITPKAKLDENSYCMLQKKCPDKIICDFCEKSFDNRYESIIHNAYHIVIPLFKQEVHQCYKCLFYFETVDLLVNHLVKKHNEVITILKNSNDEDKVEDTIVIDDDDDEDIIVSDIWSVAVDKKVSSFENGYAILDVKDEPTEEYILPDVYYDVKIAPNINCGNVKAIEKIEPQPLQNFIVDDEKKTQNVSKCDDEGDGTAQHFSVKNEIIFKKDFEIDDGIILDNDFNDEVDKKTCILKKPKQEKETVKELNNHYDESDKQFKSVHYDDLIARKKTKCQFCKQRFPNKFKKIEHEASHIRLTKPRVVVCMECDKYIGGPKSHLNHLKTKHPDRTPKTRHHLNSCVICKFKYFSFKKHIENYHPELFKGCRESDLNEASGSVSNYGNIRFEILNEPSDLLYTNIIGVCHACVNFVKVKNGVLSILGVLKQIGVRFKCSKCLKECFEINLVERTSKAIVSIVSKIKYEEEIKKKKGLTNQDRLKNIQMRMKMINKLSRFYTVFYLRTIQMDYFLALLLKNVVYAWYSYTVYLALSNTKLLYRERNKT